MKVTKTKLQDRFPLQLQVSQVEPDQIWIQGDFWMRLSKLIKLLALQLKDATHSQFKLGSH